MKKYRHESEKVPDIKAFRSCTKLLGKLGVASCFHSFNVQVPHFDKTGSITHYTVEKEINYGWSLLDSKKYIERQFNYTLSKPPINYNLIHLIKRTRQHMILLQKLNIKSADAGLLSSKLLVHRLLAAQHSN